MAQGRSFVYSADLWRRLAGHSAFDDLDITNDRFTRWDPLNQSLYVGYKVMLAGLLLQAKGDRVAMNSSVEARYPLLDDDVIAFCASIAPEYKLRGRTDKWLLRQVAGADAPAADRQPAQDDVPRQPVAGVLRPGPPASGSTSSSAPSRSAPPAGSTPRAWPASVPRRCGSPRSPPSGSSWT